MTRSADAFDDRGVAAAAEKVVQLSKFSASRTFISWILFSSVLFVYYGALIWLPSILRNNEYSEYVAYMVTTGVTAFGSVIEFCIPAIYAYVSELYPTDLRASGFGWASSMSRFSAAIVPVAFGAWLFPNLGYVGTFVIATSFLVIAATLMMFMTPETKGSEIH